MQFEKKSVSVRKEILMNDHYVAVPYDCSKLTATNGVVPAGTIVPTNDATATGILLHDVVLSENPNGTAVIHGFIRAAKLPTEPTAAAKTALKQITFM